MGDDRAADGFPDEPHPAPPRALVLAGPTAVGKSAVAIEVALRIDGEIISADSRQVYRGMDIGTAKATAAERERVPHHGLDLVGPDERYSAGQFARDATTWIEAIRARGRTPLIAGGTGFFIRALTHPMFSEPPMDRERRESLRSYLSTFGLPRLRAWLQRLDPESAERLADRGGAQRILRALEVALLTGRTLPWWQSRRPPETPPLDAVIVVLDMPRHLLYDRIDRRVDAMLDAGLVDEVAGLLADGYAPGDPGMNATGYPEIAAHLRGELSLDAAADEIRGRTRKYARRQLTWFRNKLPRGAHWLDASRPYDELVDQVIEQWRAG
jgi:tRNA dimethylallyltransferase